MAACGASPAHCLQAEAAPTPLEGSQGSAEAAEQQIAEHTSANAALPAAHQEGARHQAVAAAARLPADDIFPGPSSSQGAGGASGMDDRRDPLQADSSSPGTAGSLD